MSVFLCLHAKTSPYFPEPIHFPSSNSDIFTGLLTEDGAGILPNSNDVFSSDIFHIVFSFGGETKCIWGGAGGGASSFLWDFVCFKKLYLKN